MARAKKLKDGRVFLLLTGEEAIILRAICQDIGGHPANTARWAIDHINHALSSTDVIRTSGLIRSGMTMQRLDDDSQYRRGNN